MNRDRIAQLLKEPARVAREDLAGLRELTERYPWFSGAHLLLAMGENAAGEVLFDETLKTTAAHLPGREILFDEVEGLKGPQIAEVDGVKRFEEPEAAAPTPDPSAPDRDDIARRILDQQILEAAAAGAFTLQQNREVLLDAPVTKPTVEDSPSDEALPPPAADVPPLTSPRRFTQWLDSAPVELVASLPFKNEAAMAGSAEDWMRGKEPDPTASAPAATGKATPTPELTRDLIDRFLQQSTPQPRKAEFFDPHQAGKRSLEEQLDIVTETLARIHEKQGHWAKAAAAYRRLALKHPQKSGYFAALAKKAEQQLNK